MKSRLTEAEWARVFDLRCRSKRGEMLPREEHALCVAAFEEDSKRYAALNRAVFEATAPFGAQVKP